MCRNGAVTEVPRDQELRQELKAQGSKCLRYLAHEEDAAAIVQTDVNPAAAQEAAAVRRAQHRHAPAAIVAERRRTESEDPVLALELRLIMCELDGFGLDREAVAKAVEVLGESILDRVDPLAEELGGDLRNQELAFTGSLVEGGAGLVTGPRATIVEDGDAVLAREPLLERRDPRERGVGDREAVDRAGLSRELHLLDDLDASLDESLRELRLDTPIAELIHDLDDLRLGGI